MGGRREDYVTLQDGVAPASFVDDSGGAFLESIVRNHGALEA